MKNNILDADHVIRNRVFEMSDNVTPITFDLETMMPVEGPEISLYKQNSPFLQFHMQINSSRRVGPSAVSPTRYYANLYVAYFSKERSQDPANSAKLHEDVANWFAEQTIDGVRFRTFTPYPKSKDNGFTQYLGVIDFDFELYRGA